MELVLACKKCKKVFRKQVEEYEEADEFCPNCDNHYVIEAKTPEQKGKLVIEFEQQKGHENKMFVDEREKQRQRVFEMAMEEDWWSTWIFSIRKLFANVGANIVWVTRV